VDASTSKMPPQQPDRLLDLFHQPFDFSTHVVLWSAAQAAIAILKRFPAKRAPDLIRGGYRFA
jgi:hypothetical protein